MTCLHRHPALHLVCMWFSTFLQEASRAHEQIEMWQLICLFVFCPRAGVSVCLSWPPGIMRLISGSLRPEREISDSCVSFPSLPAGGFGDVNRRGHCILAATQACHDCHHRHLGRLYQIHRVRRGSHSCGGTGARAVSLET